MSRKIEITHFSEEYRAAWFDGIEGTHWFPFGVWISWADYGQL